MSQSKSPEHSPTSSSSSTSDQTSSVSSSLGGVSGQPLSTQVVTIRKADFKIATTDATSAKQDIVAAIYRMLRFLFTPEEYNPAETYTRDKFITLLTSRVDDPQEVVDFLEQYKNHPVLQEFYHWGGFVERIAQNGGRIVRPDVKQSQLTLAPSNLSVNVVFSFPLGSVEQSLSVRGEAVDKLEVDFTLQISLADAVYCNMNQYLNTDSAVYQQIQQCKPNLFTVPLSILEQSAVTMADTSRTVQVEQCCANFFNALSAAGFEHIAEGVSDTKQASRAGGIAQRQKLRQLFPVLDDPITAYFDDPLAVFPLETSPAKGKPAIAWETLLNWWQTHPVVSKLTPLTLINLVVSSELISKTTKKRRTVLTFYYRRTFDLSSWPMELSFDITALDRPKPLQAVVHTQQLNLMLQSEAALDLQLLVRLAERFWNNVESTLRTMIAEYSAVKKMNAMARLQGDQPISVMEYRDLGPKVIEQFKLSDDCEMFLKTCRIDLSKLTFKEQAVFYSAFQASWLSAITVLIDVEKIAQKRKESLALASLIPSDGQSSGGLKKTLSLVQPTEEKSRPKRNLQQENAEDEAIQQKVTGLAEKLRPILRRQVVDGVALTNLIPSLKALAMARKQYLKEALRSPRQPTVTTTIAVPRSESMVSSSSSSSTNPSLNGHTDVALQITVSPPDKTSSTGGQEPISQPLASTTSTQSLSSVSSTPTSSAAVTETKKAPQYDQAQNVVKGRLINKLKLNAKEAMQSLPDANNPRKHLPPDWCRDLKKYQPNIEAELILNFWRDLGVKEETKEIVPSSDQSYPWLRTAIGNLVRAQSHDLASINPHLWQNVFSTGFLETLASRDVYPTLESYAPEISMGEQHWVIVSCGFSKYKMLNQARHEENRDKRHYVGPMAEERNCVAPIKLMAKMWVIENPPSHADGAPLTPQDFFELRSIEVSISPADVEALRLHGFFNNWFSDPYRAAFRESNLLALQQSFDIDHAQLLTLQKKMQEAKSAVSNATQSTIEKNLSKYLYDRTLQMELDKFEQYVDATGFMPAEKQRLLSLTCRSYRRAQQLCAVIAAARNPTMNALEAVRFVRAQALPPAETIIFRIEDLPKPELESKETLKEREGQTHTQNFVGFSRVLSDYVDPVKLVTDEKGMLTQESLKDALGAEIYNFLATYEQGNPGYLNNNLIFQWGGVLKQLFININGTQLQANSKKNSIIKRGNIIEFINCYDRFKSNQYMMSGFAPLYAPIMCHIVATFPSDLADSAPPTVDFFFSMSEVDAIFFQVARVLNPSSQTKKHLEASSKQLHVLRPKGKSSSKGTELNIRREKFASAEEYRRAFLEAYYGRPVADAKSSHSRRPSLPKITLSQPVSVEASSAMPSPESGHFQQVRTISDYINEEITDIFSSSVIDHELISLDDLFAWLPRQLGTIKLELVRKLILEEVVSGEEDSPDAIRHSVVLIDYKVVALDKVAPASTSHLLVWPITVRFDINGLAKPVLLDIALHSELLPLFASQIARDEQFFWQNAGLAKPVLLDIALHSELLPLFASQIARGEQFFWQNAAWYLSSPYRQMNAVIEANAYRRTNSSQPAQLMAGQSLTIHDQLSALCSDDVVLEPECNTFIRQVGAHMLSKGQQLILYSVYKLSLAEAQEQYSQSFPAASSSSSSSTTRSLKEALSQLIARKEVPETKGGLAADVVSLIGQAEIVKVLREILERTLAATIRSFEEPPLSNPTFSPASSVTSGLVSSSSFLSMGSRSSSTVSSLVSSPSSLSVRGRSSSTSEPIDTTAQLYRVARRREQQLRELFGELFVASTFGQLSAQRNILKGWNVTKYFQERPLPTQNTATEPQLREDAIRYVHGQIICINGKEFKSDNLEWPALKENLRKALLAVSIPLQLAEDIIARMHQHDGGYVAFFNNTFALALSENNRPCKLSTTRFNIQYDARIDDVVTLIAETQADTLSVINSQTGLSQVVAQTPKQAVLGLGGVIRLTLSPAGAVMREVAYAQLFSYHTKATTELEDFLFPKVPHPQPSISSPRALLQRTSHSIQAVEVREFTRGPLIDAWNNFETVRKKEGKQAAKKAVGDFTRTAWRDMGGRDNQPTTEWLALIEPVATAANQERGSLPRADFIYSKMGGFLSTHLESNFYSMEGTWLVPYLNEPKIRRELLKGEISDPSYKFRITRVYTDYAQEDGSRVKLSKPLTIVAMVEVAKVPRTPFPFKITIQSITLSNKDAAALRLQAYCSQWFPSYVTEEYARLNKQFADDHGVLEKSYAELQKSSKKITNTQRRKILSQIAAYFGDTHYWGQLDTFVIAVQQSSLPLTTRNTQLTTVYKAYQDNLLLSVNILATLDDMEKPPRLPIEVMNEEGELELSASSNVQNPFVGSPLLVDLYFWQKIYWHASVEHRQIASQKEPQGFQEFLTMLGEVPAWFSKSEQLRLYRVFTLSIKEAVQQALSVKTVSEASAESSSSTTLQSKEEAKAANGFSDGDLKKIRGELLARIKKVIGLPIANRFTVLSLLQSLAKTEYEKFSKGFGSGLLRPEGDPTHPTASVVDSDDDAPGGPGTMPFEEPPPPLAQPNPPPLPKKPPPALPKQLFPTHTRSRSKSLGFFSESDPGKEAGYLRPASVGEAKYPQPLPVQPGGRDLSTGASTGQDEGELSTGEILSLPDPTLLNGEDSSRSVSPESMIRYDAEGEEGDLDLGPEDEASTSRPPPSGGRKG